MMDTVYSWNKILNILLAEDEILNTCKDPFRRRKQNRPRFLL